MGEGCPWGVTYLPAFGKGIRAGIDELAPLLIGKDPRLADSINRSMDLALPGLGVEPDLAVLGNAVAADR